MGDNTQSRTFSGNAITLRDKVMIDRASGKNVRSPEYVSSLLDHGYSSGEISDLGITIGELNGAYAYQDSMRKNRE